MVTTDDVLSAIRSHGEATYPEEGCGFLLGTVRDGMNHVHTIQRVTNRQATNRTRRYTITPDDYRAAQQAASKRGLDIVGFYHSHPDHPARPSETDVAKATFPGYTYVIVSVQEGTAGELTAWALASDRSRFNKETIRPEATTSA